MVTRVRVPATSANLGPGYDAFGLALSLYDVFEAEPADSWSVEITGEGESELCADECNEVVRAMKRVFAESGYTGAAAVRCDNGIPVGRGLGSSAAAIVGGLMLGDLIAESELPPDRVFELATELEGHPDNVAAAVYGGFTLCWNDGAKPRASRVEPGGGLAVVIALSESELATAQARQVLPATVPHADAAFSAARAGLLGAGIALGRAELVSAGLADRIHEPYREALVPDIAGVRSALLEAGVTGAVLSGAGPTLVGLVVAESDSEALAVAAQVVSRTSALPGRRVLALGIDRDGASAH